MSRLRILPAFLALIALAGCSALKPPTESTNAPT